MNRIIRGKKEVPVSEIEFEHGHETKGDVTNVTIPDEDDTKATLSTVEETDRSVFDVKEDYDTSAKAQEQKLDLVFATASRTETKVDAMNKKLDDELPNAVADVVTANITKVIEKAATPNAKDYVKTEQFELFCQTDEGRKVLMEQLQCTPKNGQPFKTPGNKPPRNTARSTAKAKGQYPSALAIPGGSERAHRSAQAHAYRQSKEAQEAANLKKSEGRFHH